jgi:UPF0042 nucleotide-binding protein
MKVKRIISFGIKHGRPSSTRALVIDVRGFFPRNPYNNKKLRNLSGMDAPVQVSIAKAPNFSLGVSRIVEKIAASNYETVYLGCTGGHHRSVYLSILVGDILGIPVSHRDIGRK